MKKYAIWLVVLGSMLWGTDALFRRPLTAELSPITIVWLEHCILALLMAPILLRGRGKAALLDRKAWMALGFISLGGSVAATSLFTYSMKYGNPSVTLLLQKSQPLFTFLLARRLLRERPARWFWACLIPAVIGAFLVSTPDWRAGFSVDSGERPAALAAIGAAALWGASTVFGRYVVSKIPVLLLTGLRVSIAVPVLGALFWIQPQAQRSLPATFPSVAAITALALIPGFAALTLFYKGLQSSLASLASIAELAFPITAVTANRFLLGIDLSSSQFMGAAVLVMSVSALSYLDTRGRGAPAGP